jgi:hypothetical protein
MEVLWLQLVDVTESGLVEGAVFAVSAIVDVGGAAIVAEAEKPVFEPGVEVVPEPGRALVPGAHMTRLVVARHSFPVAHMLGLLLGCAMERGVELGRPELEYGTGWLELKLAHERLHGPEHGPEPEPEPEPELLVEPIVVAEHRPH